MNKTLKAFLTALWKLIFGMPNPKKNLGLPPYERPHRKTKNDELDGKDFRCPQCGQFCSKEEFESGYCLDCDMMEMGLDK